MFIMMVPNMQIQLSPCKNIFFFFPTHFKMFKFWMWIEVKWNTHFWLAKQMQQHLQFVLNWKNVSSFRPLTIIRIYFTVMFKMFQWLFSGYFRNLLQLKRNELYIGYPCIFITLLLPQGKISFPTRLKKIEQQQQHAVTPTQFPFSPGPAVSNHLLPPAGPCPVVTRLVPVSKQTGEIPGPEAEAVSMGPIENLFISFLWKIAGFPVLGVLPDHPSFPVLILASPSL